jgi:predicted ATPase/DNA-binding CsgD family transcriptional regulator
MDRAEDGERTISKRGGANLPVALTSFVGRERETADVAGLLASSRLVTLTGAAGCGKTRLALRVAGQIGQSYSDGVHWIELARLADEDLVSQSVARVLHIVEQPGLSAIEQLLEALRDRRLLLVLDNCEHVLDACARLATRLLAETEVSILATSRQPLSVTGEVLYPLAPLAVPPLTLTTAGVDRFDATRLFVERARAILPHFALTADNADAVAGICWRLDGLPLAIELASARVNVLAVQQIAARLDDFFELPATHATLSHHQTMRAAIDWSYDLLTELEQVLLRRLSVFVGGCSLGMVETVCVGDGVDGHDVLELLSSLVNKSLVVAETLHGGEARYSLLETIRQYAREKLDASGESHVLRDRHLDWCLQVVEDTEPKLSSPYQQLWLNWLEGEYDNVRAALTWSLESGRIEAGLRASIALYEFWTIRDYAEEGLAWLSQLLAHVDENVSPLVRATALAYASFLAGFRGNRTAQIEYGREAAALAESVGDADKRTLFWALTGQAYHARSAGDFETEFSLARRCIQLAREMGDRYLLGLVLSVYSPTAMVLGEYDVAREMLDEGLVLLQEIGDTYRIAMALNYSGDLARCERMYVEARTAYEQSISLLRELDAPRDLASVLHNLGHTCLHLGDVTRSLDIFNESMSLQQSQRNEPGMAECLIGFAALAVAQGLPGAGTRLLAAAVANSDQTVAALWAATRMEYEHNLARARASLSETEFQAEQTAGHALSLEQAVVYGQKLLQSFTTVPPAWNAMEELTARERQVAALIARARSNDEIAESLFVSKRTVEKHISNIRSKLGFSQRAQIVRWAIENGLVEPEAEDTPTASLPLI